MKQIGVARIAKRANVSLGTVDRALHARSGISHKTRERILRIARELGYEPNLAARALSLGRSRKRICVCLPQEIHYFYDQVWEGIYDEARRHRNYGVNFVFRPLHETGEDEAAYLAKVLRGGVQGLILAPGRPAETTAIINRAEDMGVRVICVSTDAPESKRSCVVNVEPRLNGLLAGELMSGLVPPGSQVAIVTGMLRTEDHARKTEGFSASFLRYCSRGSIVQVIEGHDQEDLTSAKLTEFLEKFPDVSGIYVNTANCLPVCRVLVAKGLRERVKLVTTDLFDEMLPYLQDRTIFASVYERPYQQGKHAVSALVEHLLHDVPLEPSIHLSPVIAMRSNLHLFREAAHSLSQSPSEPKTFKIRA